MKESQQVLQAENPNRLPASAAIAETCRYFKVHRARRDCRHIDHYKYKQKRFWTSPPTILKLTSQLIRLKYRPKKMIQWNTNTLSSRKLHWTSTCVIDKLRKTDMQSRKRIFYGALAITFPRNSCSPIMVDFRRRSNYQEMKYTIGPRF